MADLDKPLADVADLNKPVVDIAIAEIVNNDGEGSDNAARTEDDTIVLEDKTANGPDTSGDKDSLKEGTAANQAKRPAIPDVDSSDDESVTLLNMRIRSELDGSTWRSLETRRRDARKRVLQGASYAALVEDRIAELEQEVSKLKKGLAAGSRSKNGENDRPSRSSSPEPSAEATKPSSSENGEKDDDGGKFLSAIKMNWEDFTEGGSGPVHCLELLIETPPTLKQRHESSARRRKPREAGRGGHETQSRVERIRLNCPIIRDILCEIMGKAVAPSGSSVMLRPFKCIFAYWGELVRRRDDLKREVDAEVVHGGAAATTEQPADSDHANVTDTTTNKPSEPPKADAAEPSHGNSAKDSPGVSQDKETWQDKETSQSPTKHTSEASKKLKCLQLLITAVETDLKGDLDLHRAYRARNRETVEFDDLWHLFAPGDIVFSPRQARAYRILSVHNGREVLEREQEAQLDDVKTTGDLLASIDRGPRNKFVIDFFGLDFDGGSLGPVVSQHAIEPFEGERRIAELEIYPISYAKTPAGADSSRITAAITDSRTLWQDLVERGRRFRSLANAMHMDHCQYRGMTVGPEPELVDSRVIIDTSYFYESKGQNQRPTLGLRGTSVGDARELKEKTQCSCSDPDCSLIKDRKFYDDRKVEEERMTAFVNENRSWLGEAGRKSQFNEDEHLVLMPGTIHGYVLHSREWHALDVNKLEPIEKSTESFNELQILSQHRRLIESQVSMHSTGVKPAADSVGKTSGNAREDLVRGKGKGLIILLHGVPGVGKTSTAECVAEYTNRPLLSITCGDIGEDAFHVQENLENYLNLAHRWGCVMLLDEADVFLTMRGRGDMHRNAVVSVFLRTLEYYAGILFLTTNKIGVVDEAFKSRIHLSLYYPPLNWRQTEKIWEINLRRIKQNRPGVQVEDSDVLHWARQQWKRSQNKGTQPWNGRQIRNACQTIAALAEFDSKGKITREHLDAVQDASSEFDKYLRTVHGGDDAERARRAHERRDDYHLESDGGDGRHSDGEEPYRSKGRRSTRRGKYDDDDGADYSDGARGDKSYKRSDRSRDRAQAPRRGKGDSYRPDRDRSRSRSHNYERRDDSKRSATQRGLSRDDRRNRSPFDGKGERDDDEPYRNSEGKRERSSRK